MTSLKALIAQGRHLIERTGVTFRFQGRGAISAKSAWIDNAAKKGLYRLRKILGAEQYEALTAAKAKRDGGAVYHITILSPDEIQQAGLSEADLLSLKADTDWKTVGVGKAENATDMAYFVVVDWPGGRKLRKSLGLPPAKDFHITLGFTNLDVHGVPKDRSSLVR